MLNKNSIAAVAASTFKGDLLRPLYGSYCFSEIPGTAMRALGGESKRGLPADCLPSMPRKAQKVVTLFVDALGWNILQKTLEVKDAKPLQDLIDEGVLSKLTSMFPSTTSAHVPAFHTGLTPGETGVFEWFQYAAGVGQSIRPLQACYAASRSQGELAKKFNLSVYCPTSSYFDELSSIGVKSYCYYAAHIADGEANKLMCKGAEIVKFDSISSGLSSVAELLKSTSDKQYVFFYFDGVDHLAHVNGPYADATIKVAAKFWRAFKENLLPTLLKSPDTLLLITADHGQIEVDPTQTIKLETIIPEVLEMQRSGVDGHAIYPGGSPRDLFIYIEPGKIDTAFALCKERLGDVADVLRADELVNAGFFGPVSEKLRANMGDIVVLPHAPTPIFWGGPNDMYLRGYRGQHGGLAREEAETMVVARWF